MKINIDLKMLDQARRSIRAPLITVTLERRRLSDREKIQAELKIGKEVNPEDVRGAPNSPLMWQGEIVLLYIKNHYKTLIQKALKTPGAGNKFHVSDCVTLTQKRAQNQFDKYVVTNSTTGRFEIDGFDMLGNYHKGIAELHVCKHCLENLDYKGYRKAPKSKRVKIFNHFDLEDFFHTYSTYFSDKPRYRDTDAPPNAYTHDWNAISERIRRNAAWQCEKCRVNLEVHKNLLHVHHKDGLRHNNDSRNLAVLCIDCHSKEPGHHHMRYNRRDFHLIQRLRREQGI